MKLKHFLVVIAGLDPAIQDNGADRTAVSSHLRGAGAARMDRRVKPGDDTGVVRSARISL
jgi:hypothetical protein